VEIDMSKPRLRLVYSSNGTQLGALGRRRSRGFEPPVIQGGGASFALEESVWEAGVELVHLGLLASCRNYLTFVQASVTVLELCTDPEKTVPRYRKSR
jgi:hypothetical protein